jgi:hypothetical protein
MSQRWIGEEMDGSRSGEMKLTWCTRHESGRGAYFVGRPGCDAGEYLGKVEDCRMVEGWLMFKLEVEA